VTFTEPAYLPGLVLCGTYRSIQNPWHICPAMPRRASGMSTFSQPANEQGTSGSGYQYFGPGCPLGPLATFMYHSTKTLALSAGISPGPFRSPTATLTPRSGRSAFSTIT